MKRDAKKVISAATRDEAEQAMATVAKVNSKIKGIESKIEQEKQKVDEKYREQLQELNDEKREPMEVLEVWAKADNKNWVNKSYELMHGTLGFRTNTPKVEKTKKGFTWDGIAELVKQYFPKLIRTTEEIDKETIIALRSDGVQMEALKEKCYITVVQNETFFVKTKEEELAAQ